MTNQSVDTHIVEVTVYTDRARVTRAGAFAANKGRQQVALEDLPDGLTDSSVSVDLSGARLLSVQVDRVFGRQTSDTNAQTLLDKQEEMQKQLQAIDDVLQTLHNEESFLRSIEVEPQENDEGIEQPIPLEPQSWKVTLDFVSESLVAVRERISKQNRLRTEHIRQMQALNVEIEKVHSYESEARKRVLIEMTSEAGGNVDVKVTYAINGPHWRPSYDVRVDASGKVEIATYAVVAQRTGEDWRNIALGFSTSSPQVGAELPELLVWRLGDQSQYQAMAATTEVGAAGAGFAEGLPEPKKKAKAASGKRGRKDRRPKPPAAPMASRSIAREEMAKSAPMDMSMDADMEAEMAPMMDAPAEPMPMGGEAGGLMVDDYFAEDRRADTGVAQEKLRAQEAQPAPVIQKISDQVWSLPPGARLSFHNVAGGFNWSHVNLYVPSPRYAAGGFDYTYEASNEEDIPSDGRERRVRLGRAAFPVELMYEVVAPLEKQAYLRATVKNDTERPLLAGEAFIFLDEDFIGRAFIDTVAASEELELSLGVDDDLKVERRVDQKAVTKGLISKKDQTHYDIKVTVQSFKKRPVKVRVRDQVPITWQKDDIDIEDIEVSPAPVEEPDRGMHEWVLAIEAGGKQHVNISYLVERPRDFELVEERLYE